MKFKKIIPGVLAAAMSLTVSAVPVCADTANSKHIDYYEDESITGVIFDSYKAYLAYYEEVFDKFTYDDYMKDADFLWLPTGLTDRTSDITEIIVSSRYCRITFDIDGTEIVSYSYKDDFDYSIVKDHGWKYDVNGAEVYMFTDRNVSGGGKMYYFEENGKYFALSVGAEFGEAGSFMTKLFIDEHLREEDGKLYYIGDEGKKESGWKTINGHDYYFRKGDCSAAAGGLFTIKGITYKFTENGVCTGKFTGKVKSSDGVVYYENGLIVSE